MKKTQVGWLDITETGGSVWASRAGQPAPASWPGLPLGQPALRGAGPGLVGSLGHLAAPSPRTGPSQAPAGLPRGKQFPPHPRREGSRLRIFPRNHLGPPTPRAPGSRWAGGRLTQRGNSWASRARGNTAGRQRGGCGGSRRAWGIPGPRRQGGCGQGGRLGAWAGRVSPQEAQAPSTRPSPSTDAPYPAVTPPPSAPPKRMSLLRFFEP